MNSVLSLIVVHVLLVVIDLLCRSCVITTDAGGRCFPIEGFAPPASSESFDQSDTCSAEPICRFQRCPQGACEKVISIPVEALLNSTANLGDVPALIVGRL